MFGKFVLDKNVYLFIVMNIVRVLGMLIEDENDIVLFLKLLYG